MALRKRWCYVVRLTPGLCSVFVLGSPYPSFLEGWPARAGRGDNARSHKTECSALAHWESNPQPFTCCSRELSSLSDTRKGMGWKCCRIEQEIKRTPQDNSLAAALHKVVSLCNLLNLLYRRVGWNGNHSQSPEEPRPIFPFPTGSPFITPDFCHSHSWF